MTRRTRLANAFAIVTLVLTLVIGLAPSHGQAAAPHGRCTDIAPYQKLMRETVFKENEDVVTLIGLVLDPAMLTDEQRYIFGSGILELADDVAGAKTPTIMEEYVDSYVNLLRVTGEAIVKSSVNGAGYLSTASVTRAMGEAVAQMNAADDALKERCGKYWTQSSDA